MPILNYASEVWGTNDYSKHESLHLSACKYALGVKSTTTTDAVYAELGRLSVKSTRHINILKFFLRLSNLENHRYARKAFDMLLADSDLGKTNWVSIARSLVSHYNINISDNASMIKTKVYNYFQSLVINNLRHHILEDKKLKTYASFKSTFKFETYLDIFSDFNMRCCFAKLRLSAHNLHIETGRYSNRNKPREERYCLFCKTKNDLVIEDEIHFLTFSHYLSKSAKR